jgi:hypothetical protein
MCRSTIESAYLGSYMAMKDSGFVETEGEISLAWDDSIRLNTKIQGRTNNEVVTVICYTVGMQTRTRIRRRTKVEKLNEHGVQ